MSMQQHYNPGASKTGEIAVGIPTYQRDQALKRFLHSVPDYISRVIVADNGMPGEHTHVYSNDWPVDIEVLDLDHDIGIGACRAAIVDAVTEEYLWMGDNDMEFTRPDDLLRLREILESDEQLGGVSGWLFEGDTVRADARDLRTVGSTVIKDGSDPVVEEQPYPHARFDFIPQAGLFRTAVYNDYSYDPQIDIYEHIDFFLGHQRQTDWEWATTPVVQTRHHKWIDEKYRQERVASTGDFVQLECKWGITEAVPGSYPDWAQLRERTLTEQAFDIFRQATPPAVWLPVRRGFEFLGMT